MNFTKKYIKKCISAQDSLDHVYFSKGDYFHCPSLMNEGEVRQVLKASKLGSFIYTKNPKEKYPQDESIWIPTKEQLNKILVEDYNTHLKLNEEGLLDHLMDDIYKISWDKGKEEYIKQD